MPSPFTSSFASAAAGNETSNNRSLGRGDSGDWSRARPNGATQTFRRPSLAAGLPHQRESSQTNSSSAIPNSGVYVPPHLSSGYQSNSNRHAAADTRYSKEQLLDLFRAYSKPGQATTDIDNLFIDGWNPGAVNGTSNGGWGKKEDYRDTMTGPEICWDHDGQIQPLALIEMSEAERETFTNSVNSPIKPPSQNPNKDGTPHNGLTGRRTSVTQSQSINAFGTNSPSTRPGARRRESNDLLQNQLASPNGSSKLSKDENTPPPSLLRRRTDLKENNFGPTLDEKDESKAGGSNPFGPLKRTTTGPAGGGFNGPSSPWPAAPQSAGFSPVGAFGNFSLGNISNQPQTPGDKRSTYGGFRGESRFKGLMNADSSEELKSRVKEKTSVSSLEMLTESSNEQASLDAGRGRSVRRAESGSHTDGDSYPTGSAALGGDDASPHRRGPSRMKDSSREPTHDDIGFTSLSISSDTPFREMVQRREFSQQQTLNSQGQDHHLNEPMSPTDTNPFQSPEGERAMPEEFSHEDSDYSNAHVPGAPYGHPTRNIQSQLEGTASDQSRTSSAGASRGFPNIGPLGTFGGIGHPGPWSAAPGAVGTPGRTLPGDSIFGTVGDVTSPSQSHLGGTGFFGGSSTAFGNAGAVGRGSKMGSLLPNAMQEQMRGDSENNDALQRNVVAGNAPSYNTLLRETDSPSRPGRMLDDLFANLDIRNRGAQGPNPQFSTAEGSQGASSHAAQTGFPSAYNGTPSVSAAPGNSYFPKPQEQDNQTANQMPATQQRQMVMPDRMRWIYRDPQGNTQGPWSGLEMHDWYKAGFFSPELQVKKMEDTDYEPLAQLIRRIGNSREPFLVPQIGIPHGNSTALGGGSVQASGNTATTPSAAPSSAQPPFANSFPSFGTTLTAEQQNALERRKQEEQYLMARQKEHLAQQQVMIKQMQHMQGGPHPMHGQQLHHHSSAHSLQSQPSYGSITSPTGYQPSPGQAPIQPPPAMPGFFDTNRSTVNVGGLGQGPEPLAPLREDEVPGPVDRMNTRATQVPYGGPLYNQDQQEDSVRQRQVQFVIQERYRLQREQEQYDRLHRGLDDTGDTTERLHQFNQLRSQMDEQQKALQAAVPSGIGQPVPDHGHNWKQEDTSFQSVPQNDQTPQKLREPLSLSEQVQKAVKESPAVQPQSPWAKVEVGLPQPFPPPQSGSPLPAPAAQRNRQNVADALNAESRSPTHTPSNDTPSATVAPWAKENNEGAKGPSLKEIQATEARKAAQQEELAAAARRAVAEQERVNQAQAIAPAPGLPSSANWASSVSPAVPVSPLPVAWAKGNNSGNKAPVATPVAATKKTLAQIQKEEEARKNRVAAASASAANNTSSVAALAGGKRYADLASKAPQASVTTQTQQNNQAWTTVGAGGKVKTPTGPAAASAPAATRVTSSGNTAPSAPSPATKSRTGKAVDKAGAYEEFQKWTRGALGKGLNAGIPVDDFVSQLLQLPAEPDIISDSIYSSSQTLDGRRFAEEFVRRRKLADKGVVPEVSTTNGSGEFGGVGTGGAGNGSAERGEGKGGWSEVAKKGGQQGEKGEGKGEAFKVVAGKRRGKR
ncbi:MAG: hypothetical protein LQ342_004097 [Letrouitia transgressa]|nr:MAG: hypothetical protein LQ342_004097 [Letrouitia transgressa]